MDKLDKMSSQSLFVKNVHLKSVESLLKQGHDSEHIVTHLKAVWCDDAEIKELIQEAHTRVLHQAKTSSAE